MPAPKLRLVEVRVQPVFMVDYGDRLEPAEYPADNEAGRTRDHVVTVIPAAEWPTYSGERFPAEVKAWQKALDIEHAEANPNRATRRAKKPPA